VFVGQRPIEAIQERGLCGLIYSRASFRRPISTYKAASSRPRLPGAVRPHAQRVLVADGDFLAWSPG
jgi:hypothetical protein